MDKDITKTYSNGEVTIVWKPKTCIHSTICWKETTGLPEVFDPRVKPWIKMEGSNTQRIVDQVKKCPSGALSFYFNSEADANVKVETDTKVEPLANGPLLVYGNLIITDKSGVETRKSKVTAFCRCGHSNNKPYCDGSHVSNEFRD